MTAFGGSGELQQGPGSGLPQLQPCQNGAAGAAMDASKREPSPWRPAAGQLQGRCLGQSLAHAQLAALGAGARPSAHVFAGDMHRLRAVARPRLAQ